MTIARTVGRNTLYTAVARLAVLGVWFAVTPRVLAVLGPERFGFWSILLVLGGSLGAVDLGLGVAVTRSVARLWSEGAGRQVHALITRAAALQVLVTALLGGGLIAATSFVLQAFHVPPAWSGEARTALAFAIATFVLGSAANLFFAALQGIQRMDRALLVVLPAAVGLGVAIVWAMGQPQPLLVLTQVQLAYATLTALGFAVALRGLRPVRATEGSPAAAPLPLRDLLVFGGWVQLNSLFGLIQAHVDKLILGSLVALAPVAAYELGARVTFAALLPPILFLGALLPAFAREHSVGEPGRLLPIYRAALDPHFALSFGIAGAIVALAPWILGAWLHEPPADATFFLTALAVTQLGNLLTGVSSTTARAGGVAHLETQFAVIGTVLHVALALVGLAVFGVRGLLVGTVLGSLLGAAWFIARMESWLGIGRTRAAFRAGLPFLGAAAVAGLGAFLTARLLSPAPDVANAWPGLLAGGAVDVLLFGLHLRILHRGLWEELLARAGRLRSRS